MAELFLTAAPTMVNFRMLIEDPVPPYAANMLAASGLFDRIAIVPGTEGDGPNITLEGRALLKAALTVWAPFSKALNEAQ